VEDSFEYEVLNAAFDTTWVETDSQTSVLLKSLICNLGSLSVTPRTSRGTTEGPQTTKVDEEDMEGSGAFQLDPIPLAVKSIQLSEDAATDIEKAVARASDWSNSTANMLSMSSSAKPGGGMASPRANVNNGHHHSRTHSEGDSSSYGSCMGDTVEEETANPLKMKLNLGQTAQPMTFKLNLPVTDANNDEGYIALPPPTARQENDSLGGTYNDMGDNEDVDVQKMKSKMREYEDQIESLIEQVWLCFGV
jgi:hypothetical protein